MGKSQKTAPARPDGAGQQRRDEGCSAAFAGRLGELVEQLRDAAAALDELISISEDLPADSATASPAPPRTAELLRCARVCYLDRAGLLLGFLHLAVADHGAVGEQAREVIGELAAELPLRTRESAGPRLQRAAE